MTQKGRIVSGLWILLTGRKRLFGNSHNLKIFHRYYYRPNTKLSENTYACDAVIIDTRHLLKGATAKEIDAYLEAFKMPHGLQEASERRQRDGKADT